MSEFMDKLNARLAHHAAQPSPEPPGIDSGKREVYVSYSMADMLSLMYRNGGFALYLPIEIGHAGWSFSVKLKDTHRQSEPFIVKTAAALGSRGLVTPVVWAIDDSGHRYKTPQVLGLTLRGESVAMAITAGGGHADNYTVPEEEWGDGPSPNLWLTIDTLLPYCSRYTLRVVEDFPKAQVDVWEGYPDVEWTPMIKRRREIMLQEQREELERLQEEQEEARRIRRNAKAKERRENRKKERLTAKNNPATLVA